MGSGTRMRTHFGEDQGFGTDARARPRETSGIALVLVLLITTLLYIVVAELVTQTEFDGMTADNQAVSTKMDYAFDLALAKVLEDLSGDLEGEGESAGGGVGGGTGGALQALGGGGSGEGGEEEAGEPGDSSRDAWYRPYAAYEDDRLTVYAFVEAENRKFNLLCLLSPDRQFRELSKERLIRLLDHLWEDTEFDLARSDAETWATSIEDWLRGERRDDEIPEIPRNSEYELDGRKVFPPHDLEELKLLQEIPEEAFGDRLAGRTLVPGLSSVLTVHSSLKLVPEEEGPGAGGARGGAKSTAPASGGEGNQAGGGKGGNKDDALGPGVRINVNLAPRPVLECLESENEIPRSLVDALLRYRNEVDEEAENKEEGDEASAELEELEGGRQKLKYFASLDDLGEVDAWDALPESKSKDRFEAMLTTKSNVFSIHLAAVYKRDESGRSFIVARARSVYLRAGEGENRSMTPVVPLHRVEELRVFQTDFPEEEEGLDPQEVDEFAVESEAWNPFYLEFYDPEKRKERGIGGG